MTEISAARTAAAFGPQTLVAAFTAASEGATALGAEVAQFAERSVQAQAAAAAEFAKVRSPLELIELQSKFYRSAMQSYSDHVSSVSGLIAGSFQKSVKPVSEQVAAATEKPSKSS